MNNKVEITERRMYELIAGRFIVFVFLFSILVTFLYSAVILIIETEWVRTLASWILQIFAIFLPIFYSIKLAFYKNTISSVYKNGLIKKLIISIIMVCILNWAYDLYSVEKKIQDVLESNISYQMIYEELKENTTEESFKKYEEMVDAELDKIRIKAYKNVAITQSIKSAMYICMIPVVKRMINKEVND